MNVTGANAICLELADSFPCIPKVTRTNELSLKKRSSNSFGFHSCRSPKSRLANILSNPSHGFAYRETILELISQKMSVNTVALEIKD